MPIQGTISIDTAANTMTLTILQSAVTIESITYTYATNSLLFSTMATFTLSATDFVAFAGLLDSFNTSIAKSFNPSTTISQNFTIHQVQDENNGSGSLTFQISKTVHPFYSLTASYPLGSVNFDHRTNTTTLLYDEWLYYHSVSVHFEDEIHKFFKV